MDAFSITIEDEIMAERACYKFLEELKSYLEWIPNNNFKNNYKLNNRGIGKYPQLK